MNSLRAIHDAKRTGKPVNRELARKTTGYRYEVMTN